MSSYLFTSGIYMLVYRGKELTLPQESKYFHTEFSTDISAVF